MRAAIFISEFGFPPGAVGDRVIASQLLEMEKHRVGFAFWTWKENGGGNWSMFVGAKPTTPMQPNGCLKSDLERLLARVYPLTSPDPSLTYHYDPNTGGFTLSAQGRPGDAATVLYVPAQVTGQVTASGGLSDNSVTVKTDGSRIVTSSPSGGAFSISIAPAPLALTGCA
jgi:hypothetical protein